MKEGEKDGRGKVLALQKSDQEEGRRIDLGNTATRGASKQPIVARPAEERKDRKFEADLSQVRMIQQRWPESPLEDGTVFAGYSEVLW